MKFEKTIYDFQEYLQACHCSERTVETYRESVRLTGSPRTRFWISRVISPSTETEPDSHYPTAPRV